MPQEEAEPFDIGALSQSELAACHLLELRLGSPLQYLSIPGGLLLVIRKNRMTLY